MSAAPTTIDFQRRLDTAELVHYKSSEERTLAVLVAYMDESGIHKDAAVCAIAGYVGSSEEWKKFEYRWKQILSREGVSQFHMSEFESGHGEFKGWSKGRKEQLLTNLLKTIMARDIQDVGSAVN